MIDLEGAAIAIKRASVAFQSAVRSSNGRTPIVFIGDSWSNLTIVNTKVPVDMIDWMRMAGLNVVDAGIPGYTIEHERERKLYRTAIRFLRSDNPVFMLSLGGNDMLESIPELAENPDAVASRKALALASHILEIQDRSGGRAIVAAHGYDYPSPKESVIPGFNVVSDMFRKHGIEPAESEKIIKAAIDSFNRVLSGFASENRMVEHIDIRGVAKPGHWLDGMHLTPVGYMFATARIVEEFCNRPMLARCFS